jgi:hypothetical protein
MLDQLARVTIGEGGDGFAMPRGEHARVYSFLGGQGVYSLLLRGPGAAGPLGIQVLHIVFIAFQLRPRLGSVASSGLWHVYNYRDCALAICVR